MTFRNLAPGSLNCPANLRAHCGKSSSGYALAVAGCGALNGGPHPVEVGYLSHESIFDSKFRSIDVRVNRPQKEVVVIAKTGYYPSGQDYR